MARLWSRLVFVRIFLATAVMAPSALRGAEAGLSTLASEVSGVVGSGDKLGLKLGAGEASRVLRPGEIYGDGWVLRSVTASQATLTKGAEVRQVGLNPTGALAAGEEVAPATQVNTIGSARPAAEILAELRASEQWDGQSRPGLTLDETQRFLVQTYLVRQHTQALMRSLPPGSVYTIGPEEMRSLGFDYQDYLALGAKVRAAAPTTLTPTSGAPPPGGSLAIIRPSAPAPAPAPGQ